MQLSFTDFPITEEGSNWTVAVFKCPRKNWTDVLISLFSELDKQEFSLIPHYTLRAYEDLPDSLIVSFRILRQKEHEAAIVSLLESFLKTYEYAIDPKGSSCFSQYHAWVSTVGWTKDKCEILSKISRFSLEIINADSKNEHRLDWAHLFSNMIAIFEYEKASIVLRLIPILYCESIIIEDF